MQVFYTIISVIAASADSHALSQTAWETCISTGAQCLLDSNNPNDTAAFMPPKICEQGSLPNYYVSQPFASRQYSSLTFECRSMSEVLKMCRLLSNFPAQLEPN